MESVSVADLLWSLSFKDPNPGRVSEVIFLLYVWIFQQDQWNFFVIKIKLLVIESWASVLNT